MAEHRIPESMLRQPIQVLLVGCGGTGSAVAAGLPYLHRSLLAFGHPHGLRVTLMDGDDVSPANCVRQPFTQSEIGLNKAIVLANRANLFWGLEWEAVPEHLVEGRYLDIGGDIIIGCVDRRAARATIRNVFFNHAPYWLDFGNDEDVRPLAPAAEKQA